ncbi:MULTISPECIES: hypothetical protein [Microvirga]|uniref:hypothetical protein n=1 Tax=Microvirga TaxID=186650 RepID=UPI001FE15C13|nr:MULTISPECIES: hypothetical protein [Microvirga]
MCYGTAAGGLLGDKWLDGPEPPEQLENRSLAKYGIIDDLGGWDLFQAFLTMLHQVADPHGTDAVTVASAAMLERPGVATVIIGTRPLSSGLERRHLWPRPDRRGRRPYHRSAGGSEGA